MNIPSNKLVSPAGGKGLLNRVASWGRICRLEPLLAPRNSRSLRFGFQAHAGLALVSVLGAIVVCLLLLSFTVKLVSAQRSHQLQAQARFAARAASQSGIAYAQAKLRHVRHWRDLQNLNGRKQTLADGQHFQIQTALQGGYLRVTATGYSGSQTHRSEAFLGQVWREPRPVALQIAESPFEIYASGNTRIRGDVWLPQAKITPKSLHGLPAAKSGFLSGKLFGGKSKTAFSPPLAAAQAAFLLIQAQQMQAGLAKLPDDGVWDLQGKTVKYKGDLTLDSAKAVIRGPGILLVKGSVAVKGPLEMSRGAWLVASQDIGLSAPVAVYGHLAGGRSIRSNQSLRGCVSLFSGGLIELEGPVQCHAPSLAGLVNLPFLEPGTPAAIRLQAGRFAGTIFSWPQAAFSQSLLQLGAGVQGSGYVVFGGKTELRGPFRGRVQTRVLEAASGAQRFQNWFKDLRIDRAADEVNWPLPVGMAPEAAILGWQQK